MSILFRKSGILSTVQDLGRTGSRSLGVNPGGAMDVTATRITNILVGNDEGAPILEMHYPAAEIEFGSDLTIAIGGADFTAKINGASIPNWSTTMVKAGDVLRFADRVFGARSYLAVTGGIQVEPWLGSASTNLTAHIGGYRGRPLRAGDRLELGCRRSTASREVRPAPSVLPRYSRFPTVRVVTAGEFEFLTASSEQSFVREGFTLSSACDRMGYRLEGKPLHMLSEYSMVSAGVGFGTIQLLPDGGLIVLMADHQTSGGYPRIANVISVDLPLLAQCGPGDGVSFQIVTIDEAERLATTLERELNFFRVGCRLRNQNATYRS